MSDLVTLGEFKTAEGIPAGDVDVVRDARYQQAITYASDAIRTYTDRNFADAAVATTHTYEYDGSGFLDIDDCSVITSVVYSIASVDTPLFDWQWRAEPFNQPQGVYTYLVLVGNWNVGISPEMGFMQNMDVIFRERGLVAMGPVVKVTGTFGWPVVPGAVKQAVLWTAKSFSEKLDPYISESIAGYSRTTAIRGDIGDAGIPDRAKELLAPYVRYKIG